VPCCAAYVAPSAGAIIFGQLDGGGHPNVGALFADWEPEVPGPDFLCNGTLISPTVFLTGSHCTDFLPEAGVDPDEVFVSFSSDVANDDGSFRTGAQELPGTYHPLKGSGGTWFGDSGGPHFLGTGAGTYPGTVVALTVSGDAACRSTDVDYRLDTASARAFLDDFVTLP
jgi:hypothetical protein